MFSASVVHGNGIGRKMGLPTANLDISKAELGLNAGVYAAIVLIDGKEYKAALAVQENPYRVEANVLDLDNIDLYGREIKFECFSKVSDIIKFDSEHSLVKKINSDLRMVEEYFNK